MRTMKKNRTVLNNDSQLQIPNLMRSYNHILKAIRSKVTLLVLVACCGYQVQMTAQCTAKALACNNLVHVSLDTNCLAVITPNVVLEGEEPNEALYRVEVYAPDGTKYEWNPTTAVYDTIRQDFGGAQLETRVYCIASGIYCWGYVKIEDKIKPTIEISPIDTAVSCFVFPFDLEANALVTRVSFSDNGCLKPDSLGITDTQETIFPCRDTVKIVRRTWSVVDAAGNQCDTTQTIYLLRADISELTYPKDTLIDCLDEGDLTPAKLGEIDTRECEHFEITYKDVEIPVCGKARKILRRWRVTDICTTDDTLYTQVIKIEDNHAPEMDFSSFDIPVDRLVAQKFNCLSDAEDIPNPIVTDCNLDQTTLQAFYQLVDNNGNPTGEVFDAYVNDLETFDLRNIPIGVDFVVIFVANDGCGNISRDTSNIVQAIDTNAPNAVCEGNTSVVLNNQGEAEVLAETFDDHSFDNCGITNKLVRRFNETTFRDRILFNCNDVPNNPVRVVFRVFDAAGLTSDCIVNVFVQDKRPVTLTCPGDRFFNCDVTREEVIEALEGEEPVASESCGIALLVLDVPDYTLSNCGYADFIVTWTATDANGLTSTCTRNVSIGNAIQSTVVRPSRSTFTVANCSAGTEPEDIPNSTPTVLNEDCEHIAITHEDTRVMGETDHCVKIIRKWTIIDWCLFDGGNLSSAIIDQFDQTIVITDIVAPEFTTECIDIFIADNNKDCHEEVSLIAMASDDCTPADEIAYTYAIDMGNDGSLDHTGLTNDASGVFDIGTHRVTFTATDVCGNVTECSYLFQVRSTKEPVVALLTNVEVVMEEGGTAVLEAINTNASSSNGCLPDGVFSDDTGLIFSFNEEGTAPTRTFTCSDIPNGRGEIVPVRVWVIDSIGNKESVIVNVAVSDNAAMACPDVIGAAVLSGQITDEGNGIVEGVPVSATHISTGQKFEVETDEYGLYTFNNLEQYEDYEVQAHLDGYPLAGVTTIDIVYIQQHILGLTTFTSPYKLLAADVNDSRSVTGADLVELRKLILGRTVELIGPSWKFVDKNFEFDMDYVFNYDEMVVVNDTKDNDGDHNFVGLKVGDVNGNAFTVLAQGYVGPRSTEVMNVNVSRKGDIVRYSLSANDMDEIIGMQLAIQIDETMDVVALGSDYISLSDEHFVLTDEELRVSWTNETAINARDQELMFIDVRVAGSKTQALEMNSKGMPGEIYNSELESFNLVLRQQDEVIDSEGFVLHQNTPNPFMDATDITFDMPQSGTAHLTINDINGRSVYEETGLFKQGRNTIRVDADDIKGSGIFYYTVISDGFKETRRMIVLH